MPTEEAATVNLGLRMTPSPGLGDVLRGAHPSTLTCIFSTYVGQRSIDRDQTASCFPCTRSRRLGSTATLLQSNHQLGRLLQFGQGTQLPSDVGPVEVARLADDDSFDIHPILRSVSKYLEDDQVFGGADFEPHVREEFLEG